VPRGLVLPAADLVERFSRSSGPGGQGVNTTDSRAELRFDVRRSAGLRTLSEAQRDRAVSGLAGRMVGDEVIIGRSAHSAAETAAAADEPGVGYFCAGPCWPTPTKPGRPAPGLDLVRTVAGRAPARPWFAIGGIDGDRLGEVLAAGAERVVVVRAITEADDPRAAAAGLSARLRS
jgi:thiamine-phosphate pyrophosphorylase